MNFDIFSDCFFSQRLGRTEWGPRCSQPPSKNGGARLPISHPEPGGRAVHVSWFPRWRGPHTL